MHLGGVSLYNVFSCLFTIFQNKFTTPTGFTNMGSEMNIFKATAKKCQILIWVTPVVNSTPHPRKCVIECIRLQFHFDKRKNTRKKILTSKSVRLITFHLFKSFFKPQMILQNFIVWLQSYCWFCDSLLFHTTSMYILILSNVLKK